MEYRNLSWAEDKLAADPGGLHLPEEVECLLAEERFRTPEVCLALFRKSDLVGLKQPVAGLDLARTAARLVDRLPGVYRLRKLKALLKSRALVMIGSRLRGLARLCDSGWAFKGSIVLGRGAGPFDVADLQRRQAYLLGDQRRTRQGLALANHALNIYRSRHAPAYLIGRAFLGRGFVYSQAGMPEVAVSDYREASHLIDPKECFLGYYCAVHNLASALVTVAAEPEEIEEAVQRIGEAKAIGFEANTVPGTSLIWIEGLLLGKIGKEAEAETNLRLAIRGLLDLEAPYETAQAMLDLSALLCRQGRHRELVEVAAEMFPLFGLFRGNREVIAGLKLFHHAAIQRRVNDGLIARVRRMVDAAARRVD